jgi:predicted MFS family arabinose efflux permease
VRATSRLSLLAKERGLDVTAAEAIPERRRAARPAVVALGVTQMIAWGTTYYLPGVFSAELQRDLGLSQAAVFSGIAIMLITSAVLSWPAGVLMDRNGAGRSMPAGSLFLALGLLVLSMAQGLWTYAAAWMLFGCGMSLAMSNAMLSAMAQIEGQNARRGMVIVMLFGGLAATLFWPLSLWLETVVGWRGACVVFAGLHLLICAPLHAVVLARATAADRRQDRSSDEPGGLVPPDRRRLAAVLLLIAVGGNGFVSWGLDLHLIAILKQFGLTTAVAVAVAAWKGPATLIARGIDIFLAGRVTPINGAVAAGLLMPAGLAIALAWTGGLAAGVLFITVYSFGAGLMTVVRAALPLTLLGAQGYAVTMGRLALPTQIIFALSPMTYGLFLERFGLTTTLWISMAASLSACAAQGSCAGPDFRSRPAWAIWRHPDLKKAQRPCRSSPPSASNSRPSIPRVTSSSPSSRSRRCCWAGSGNRWAGSAGS